MNRKILSVFVFMLIMVAVLPTASSINKSIISRVIENDFEIPQNDKDSYQNLVVMENPPDLSDIGYTKELPISEGAPSEFSWINYDSEDWTTIAKHQGNCGSCWDFAVIAAIESTIKISEDCPELNPDLSEQYVLSCLSEAGSCRGGNAFKALRLIMETTPEGNYHNGVIFESCFGYQANDDIPCSEKCAEWEDQLVPISGYDSYQVDGTPSDIESIKTLIMETGPIISSIKATDAFKAWGSLNHNPDAYYPDLRQVVGYNHVVITVGWKDVSSIQTGGYWICKNSWGEEWGYDGFFNIAFNSLNINTGSVITVDYDPDSFDWPPIVNTGGPYGTYLGEETAFDASDSVSVEGTIVDYSWDFGDEETGSGVSPAHTYSEAGVYTVTLTITDSEGLESAETTRVWVQESNEPPLKPTIEGPTTVGVGKPYEYTFTVSEPEGNDIWYFVDWGDGTTPEWHGPYTSSEEAKLKHSFDWLGNYIIKAKAKDVFGDEGEFGGLAIKCPRTRETYRMALLTFIEKILNSFQLLSKIR